MFVRRSVYLCYYYKCSSLYTLKTKKQKRNSGKTVSGKEFENCRNYYAQLKSRANNYANCFYFSVFLLFYSRPLLLVMMSVDFVSLFYTFLRFCARLIRFCNVCIEVEVEVEESVLIYFVVLFLSY